MAALTTALKITKPKLAASLLLSTGLVIAALGSACSTPAVENSNEQNYDNAVSSYGYCNSSSTQPYNSCNSVSYGQIRSFNDYIGTGAHARVAQSPADEKILQTAYLSYLATASPEELANMARQWQELAGTGAR